MLGENDGDDEELSIEELLNEAEDDPIFECEYNEETIECQEAIAKLEELNKDLDDKNKRLDDIVNPDDDDDNQTLNQNSDKDDDKSNGGKTDKKGKDKKGNESGAMTLLGMNNLVPAIFSLLLLSLQIAA